jgi:hypothetical protein
MRLQTVTFVVLLFIASARGAERPTPPASFDLVKDGKAACAIVLADRPGPAARLAALELQFHILKQLGVELPIRSEKEPFAGRRILMGESAATRQQGLRSQDFAPQEYLIAFRPDTVILMGRDWEDTEAYRKLEGRPMVGESLAALRHRLDYGKTVGLPERSVGEIELPGIYDDQGTCLATYDFLERFCGVRWYGPSAATMVVPPLAAVAATGADVRRSPALKHRSAFPGGNWPFLRGQWGEFNQDQVRLYWRRIRQGGERWATTLPSFPMTT